MDKAAILAMTPGSELDALVATRVMGWVEQQASGCNIGGTFHPQVWCTPTGVIIDEPDAWAQGRWNIVCRVDEFRPSLRVQSAERVAVALQKTHWLQLTLTERRCSVALTNRASKERYKAHGKTMAEAIAKAALLTVAG